MFSSLGDVLIILAWMIVSTWYFNWVTELLKPKKMSHRRYCWMVSLTQWGLVLIAGLTFSRGWFGIFQAIGLMLFLEYGWTWHFSAKDRQFDLYPLVSGNVWAVRGLKANVLAWTISFLGAFVCYIALLL
jgi:hypothetical protein